MSAFKREQFTAGHGWTATASAAGVVIHVEPVGDPLPGAVEALVAPARRRFATIQWIGEDDHGWDVYELQADKPTSHLVLV